MTRVAWWGVLGVFLIGSWLETADAQNGKRPAARKPAAATTKDRTGADAITLRDGKVLLGQVVEPSPKGTLTVLARRAFVEKALPEWAAAWEKAGGANLAVARSQRRERLKAWKADRGATAGGLDKISSYLDRELARADGGGRDAAPLMWIKLAGREIKSIDRRGPTAARALRAGWILGFDGVETMPLEDLKAAIAGRGISLADDSAIAIDDLTPLAVESEPAWRLRRAATEVLNDEGLRFIRHGNVLLAEPAPGQAPDPTAVAAVLNDAIRDVLGERQVDPLAAKLAAVAARGRIGAIVTRAEVGADFDGVTVEAALYVRGSDGAWNRGPWRAGTLRTADVPRGGVEEIAGDPQVKSAMSLIDAIGGGLVTPEMKRTGLAVGATTKMALGMARSALNADLGRLAIPLEPSPAILKPKL